MPTKEVQKGVFEAEVLSNQQIRRCYYRLNLEFDAQGSHLFRNVKPGQFLELDLSRLAVPNESDIPEYLREQAQKPILLRRPFSFSDVFVSHDKDRSYVRVEILYCVLGPSTVRMTSLKSRDRINVLGPLGNGFSVPKEGLSTAILVAGGMGSPPILHLAGYLKKNHPNTNIVTFVGAKTCEDLPYTVRIGNIKGLALEEFELIQVPSYIATDDGSAGFHGFVTDYARRWLQNNKLENSSIIYACGPEPMLAATARLAEEFSLRCQVSMERMMACGIGLCQSCAIEVKSNKETEYKLCCKDGPVFDSKQVVFQDK